jgi:outer membrane biosynthesis protein TonB
VWWRVLRAGLFLSILGHLIFLILGGRVTIPPMEETAALGPRMGDPREAGGGGAMEMVELRVAAEAPEEPVEVPVPEPVPEPEPVVEPTPAPSPTPAPPRPGPVGPPVEGTGPSPGSPGPSTGPGDAGAGQGDAGAGQTGTGAFTPPRERGVILPPPGAPRSARGMEITVHVYVNAQGRVVANQTRLEPPTPDAGYNRRLISSAADWTFDPARRDGQPVAAWYSYSFIF